MKYALVTGGTGFIGAHLAQRLLADGWRVRLLTRNRPQNVDPRFEVIQGDIRDRQAVERAVERVGSVFHLAAKAHALAARRDAEEHRLTTVEGTRTLTEAAGRAGVRSLVFVSSLAVYGHVDGPEPHDESTTTRPVSAYGLAKLEAERIVDASGARFGMHVACAQPAMVYGPGAKGNLPRLIRLVDRGLCPQVPELGAYRSVVSIEAVIDALLVLESSAKADHQRYIVADEKAYSTHQMIELIARALGTAPPRVTVPVWVLRTAALTGDVLSGVCRRRILFDSVELEKLIGSAWFSGARLKRELGVAARGSLEQAMPDLIAAYRSRS